MQANNWIKCIDRLPPEDGAYLAYDGRYVSVYSFIFKSWQANEFVKRNITHWMPLPKPPEDL